MVRKRKKKASIKMRISKKLEEKVRLVKTYIIELQSLHTLKSFVDKDYDNWVQYKLKQEQKFKRKQLMKESIIEVEEFDEDDETSMISEQSPKKQ